MAYTMKLGTFSKLENSTAQPTTTGWTEVTVSLKDGCDLDNPTFLLYESVSNAISYNYATIFGRYYWIRGKRNLRQSLCEIDCELDEMATFKTEIGSSSLYVLRAAGDYDGAIPDNYYLPKAAMTFTTQTEPNFTEITYDSGYYILNIFGTQSTGYTTLWQLTPENFTKLIRELYLAVDGWSVGDVFKKVMQYFAGNPLNLITSAMYFPIPFASDLTADETVKIGGWSSSTAVGKVVHNPIKPLGGFSPTIAAHPKAASRGVYLNIAPYAKYELFVPAIGIVNLDTTQLRGVSSIYVTRQVDAITGKMMCIAETDSLTNPHYLMAVEGQIGVPISLGGENGGGSFISGAVSSLGMAVTAAVTGGASLAIGAAAAGISTIAGSIGSSVSNSSTRGSIVNLLKPMQLFTTFFDIPDENNTEMGRPLCKTKTISTLSGYIKVSEGDVAIPAPLPIQQRLKAKLEAGFFYE